MLDSIRFSCTLVQIYQLLRLPAILLLPKVLSLLHTWLSISPATLPPLFPIVASVECIGKRGKRIPAIVGYTGNNSNTKRSCPPDSLLGEIEFDRMCFLSPAQCDDFQLDELDFPSVFQLQSPIVISRHCFVSKRFAILRKMMKFVGIIFPIEIIIIKHIKKLITFSIRSLSHSIKLF